MRAASPRSLRFSTERTRTIRAWIAQETQYCSLMYRRGSM